MINVWDYVNCEMLEIMAVDGRKFTGRLVCVFDAEESGETEDNITIEVSDDYIIGFLQSEIKEIKVLK